MELAGLLAACSDADGKTSPGDEALAAPLPKGLALSTQSIYQSHIRAWVQWCTYHDREPWPAASVDLKAFLRDELLAGSGARTLHGRLTAIRTVHRAAGYPDPTLDAGIRTLLGKAEEARRLAIDDQIDAVLPDGLAPSTRATYRTQLRAWWRWCAGRGYKPYPARSGDIEDFLREALAAGNGVFTLKSKVGVIRMAHREGGQPDPTRSPGIQEILRST